MIGPITKVSSKVVTTTLANKMAKSIGWFLGRKKWKHISEMQMNMRPMSHLLNFERFSFAIICTSFLLLIAMKLSIFLGRVGIHIPKKIPTSK